jgi:hypothetical protein
VKHKTMAGQTAEDKVDQFIRMANKTSYPPGTSREDFIRSVTWRIDLTYDELRAIKEALTWAHCR